MKSILILLAAWAAAEQPPAPSGGLPTEIVIRGEGGKVSDSKPPLKIEVDPYETIRADLAPTESFQMANTPLTVSWQRTHPEYLMNERVAQPWRTTFSRRPGIPFRVREQLESVLGGAIDDRQARQWSWTLTIADEEGRVFQHYEGSSNPPVEIVWNGQNKQGEWIGAGRSYSPVYAFTGPDGSQRTRVGALLQFKGVDYQEDTGHFLALDSMALFGPNKSASELQPPAGPDLLRSAADLIKRHYSGIPIMVRVFASTKELAAAQAAAVQSFLQRELMVAARHVTTESDRAPFSDQRVDVVVLNR